MPRSERPQRSVVRFLRAACFVALVGSPASAQEERTHPAASAGAEGDRAQARRSFELGVELARAGRYEEAKREFYSAYQAYPHYAVLYNIAQADVQLGNIASAVAWLERYLLEGEAALREEQRLAAQRQLESLRAALREEAPNEPAPAEAQSAQVGAAAGSGPPPAVVDPSLGVPPVVAPAPLAAPGSPPLAGAAAPTPVAAPLSPAPAAAEEAPTPRWGWILAGTGAALLGTAAGLYLWNDQRHERWERDRRELDALPNLDAVLRTDLQRWNEAKANNDLLSSIQTIDVVALVLAGTGALTLGAGAWELMLRPAPAAHAASGALVSCHTRW